ncbi:hypothetical protein QBC36DRAFT_291160 [Triangularia setosa]|uniref:Uncharacterized protein n=1 Tax=Triangularia setosa TaxID=2587417 RepID=A0AAN6W5G0_9PEZI|nr:hypothetical protein QBC36DRAFT_291160 [Podospora setosa]
MSRLSTSKTQNHPPIKGVEEVTDGVYTVPASRVTSAELKQYLDTRYSGRWAVQLKRDLFRITITPSA